MPTPLKFMRAKISDDAPEERYVILVAREIIGEIRLISDHQRPVWVWRIVVADKVVANGAAFTLAAAKNGSKFAWTGHGAAD